MFNGLTETSWLNDAIESALAESWEPSDDGLEWKLDLRRDVTWHDGELFTARDVNFTFNRIIYNDDIPTTNREAFIFNYIDAATPGVGPRARCRQFPRSPPTRATLSGR